MKIRTLLEIVCNFSLGFVAFRWAGDLDTFIIDVFNHRGDSKYTGIIEERTHQAAYDHIGMKTDGNFYV